MPYFDSFGPCLKALLKQLGLSQSALARKMGYSRAQVGHYANDHYQPSPRKLKELERAIGQGYSFIQEGGQWSFTNDLMQAYYAQLSMPLLERLKQAPDSQVKARIALHGGFEEVLHFASLIRQHLDPHKHEFPYEIGYRFTEALEAIALGYQAKIPGSVSVEENDPAGKYSDQ